MFYNCRSLTDISILGGWDVSNLENVSNMFRLYTNLSNASALNDWNIIKVKNFNWMFGNCKGHPTFSKRSGVWNNYGTFCHYNKV